jgi:ABC-type bacteriocin/lantibiotic exporter with double-glycine peptidase domain
MGRRGDAKLFAGFIRDTVSFFDLDAKQAKVEAVAQMIPIHDIMAMPVIIERDMNISARQLDMTRIVIASRSETISSAKKVAVMAQECSVLSMI